MSDFYREKIDRINDKLINQLYSQLERFSSVHEEFKQLTLAERKELIELREQRDEYENIIKYLKIDLNETRERNQYHWELYLKTKKENEELKRRIKS